MPFTPPHLPVLNELDNTRNWEALRQFWKEFEEGGGGGGSGGALFKSYVATDEAPTVIVGGVPKLLPTPDEVSFTLSADTLVLVSASMKYKAPASEARCWLFLDNTEALNEAGNAVKGEPNSATLRQANIIQSTSESSHFAVGDTNIAGTPKLDLGGWLPYWLTAGSHKFDLRFNGEGSKFKERRLLVFVPGSELSSAPLASGAAGGDLEGTYPNPTILKSVLAGAWTNPETFNAKTEATTTCQVRKELSAQSARLKGTVTAKEELAANTKLFTLPVGFRPPEATRLWGVNRTKGTTQLLLIEPSGTVENRGTAVLIGEILQFDGLTWTLT